MYVFVTHTDARNSYNCNITALLAEGDNYATAQQNKKELSFLSQMAPPSSCWKQVPQIETKWFLGIKTRLSQLIHVIFLIFSSSTPPDNLPDYLPDYKNHHIKDVINTNILMLTKIAKETLDVRVIQTTSCLNKLM